MRNKPALKRALDLVATALAALALLVPAAAGAQTLNIYNWSDYIGETTLRDFTEATGIRVNYDVYDSNDVLEAKLLAGRSGYDLVVPTAEPYLARQIRAGVYRELDKSLIPNLANLDPQLMAAVAVADPGNRHAVIYQWGTNGIGYNVNKIRERMADAPLKSWDMIFKPEVVARFADCGVTMLDAANEVLPIALKYLGKDPTSENPQDLQAAEQLLLSIRPHIRYFHSSQYINDLANGDICLALGWSGDIFQAAGRAAQADNGVTITYAIPQEGTLMWFDMMAIPADAPHAREAHAFINFVLQPAVMAGITNTVSYANAVPASLPLVEESIRDNPNIFPPPEVRERLFVMRPASQATERLRTRIWTRVRTGQ